MVNKKTKTNNSDLKIKRATNTRRRRQTNNRSRVRTQEMKQVKDDATISKKLAQKVERSLMYDPRASTSSAPQVFLADVNPVVPIVVPVQADTFIGPAIAPVSYAIQRGWTLNSTNDSDPYFAMVYLVNAFIAAAQNEVPQFTSCPRWMSYIMQALNKKKVKAGSGFYEYSFDVQGSYTPDYLVPMGPQVYNRAWQVGKKGTTRVNALFSTTDPPDAYTEANGKRAAQSLWLYLAEIHHGQEMHETVSISEPNMMTFDASAFSVLLPSPGGGFGDVGGWQTIAMLEVPIKSPLFACFKTNLSVVLDPSRASCFPRNFTGDGLQLSGLMMESLTSEQVHMKTPPKIHFVDFNMFATVLAHFVRNAIQNAVQTQDFREGYATNTGLYDQFKCPLTIQEMTLILRAICMQAFEKTQFAYQSMYPRTAEVRENEFVAYVAGAGTSSTNGTVQANIPLLLKENLLALTWRRVMAGRGGKRNPTDFVSVIGQYESDRLTPKDFQVIIDDETTLDAFTVEITEVPIDLIDGKTGNDYLWINDPAAILELSTTWNEWLQRVGDFTQAVGPLGSDKGIDPLYSGCMTEHWFTPPVGKSRSNSLKKKSLTPMEERFKKIDEIEGDSIYSTRAVVAASSVVPPFASAWDSIQQYLIKPINKFSPITNSLGSYTGYTRIATYMGEPHQIALGSGSTNFQCISTRLRDLGVLMVKTRFNHDQTINEFLLEMEKTGGGGILSSVVATLAGGIFPGIAPIANAIASVSPI